MLANKTTHGLFRGCSGRQQAPHTTQLATASSSKAPQQQQQQNEQAVQLQKRSLLVGIAGLVAAGWLQQAAPAQAAAGLPQFDLAAAAADLVPAVLQLDLTPDQSQYNPADPDLRDAAGMLQQALNAETVQEEERLWTEVITKYQGVNAVWMPDVVGRAYGNRGNARSRQGKLGQALTDYNASIRLCPWSVDPVINRGVALEALGRWEEAAADYKAVLAVAPNDPVPWNNLGNTYLGLQRWGDAVECFDKAIGLSRDYSFAAANKALAMFQLGQREEAIREMRALLRRYPDFPDMRAALAAAQWAAGREGDAETNWQRVEDPRYKDMGWLVKERRWPPALTESLQAFLQLKSI